MKILICDNLNQQVYKELETIGDCVDISKSNSRDKDLACLLYTSDAADE